MSSSIPMDTTLPALDNEIRALVRLAGAIAGSSASAVRAAMEDAVGAVRNDWVEEAILQSYLFAGFPRTLNAMREWRRVSGQAAPSEGTEETHDDMAEWTSRGEATCRAVYGLHYEKLRQNIRALHPALDAWMITEGYGKILSRPGLDLRLRELCIIAACAVAGQERQLRSHLLGARNVGASAAQISETLDAIADLMTEADARTAAQLWQRLSPSLGG